MPHIPFIMREKISLECLNEEDSAKLINIRPKTKKSDRKVALPFCVGDLKLFLLMFFKDAARHGKAPTRLSSRPHLRSAKGSCRILLSTARFAIGYFSNTCAARCLRCEKIDE